MSTMKPQAKYFTESEAKEYLQHPLDVGFYDPEETYEPGWYGRLSAPGYLDCTDWVGPFDSEHEAIEYIKELTQRN